MNNWTNVNDEMPKNGKNVLATYKNCLNKDRIIKAFYAEKYAIEQNSDSDYYEWDEETENAYLPEGWHESLDNWEEYSSVNVTEGDITHWMPLPKPPKDK